MPEDHKHYVSAPVLHYIYVIFLTLDNDQLNAQIF